MTYISKRGSQYGAILRRFEHIGVDGKGNDRYRLTWRPKGSDEEFSANTRGFVKGDLMALSLPERVNIIRDGRGSVIVIQRAPSDLPLSD